MSKSVTRVRAASDAAGSVAGIRRMDDSTGTAGEAADALGVAVDQIAKSVIFRDPRADTAVLFITAGGNRVDATRAADQAGGPLERAEAGFVRAWTGFVIGGVASLGHLNAPRA